MSLLVIHRMKIYGLSARQELSESDDARNLSCGQVEEESRGEFL